MTGLWAPARRRQTILVAGAIALAGLGLLLVEAGLGGWFEWLGGGATLLGSLIVAGLVIGAAMWRIPPREEKRLRDKGVSEEKIAEVVSSTRATIAQAAGGIGLILTLAVTAYQVNETRRTSGENLRILEQGQVAERFSRAIEQLGAGSDKDPALNTRIGGLYSLLQIGIDSERDRFPALLVLLQYIANNHKLGDRPGRVARPSRRRPCVALRPVPRQDVQTALQDILPRLGLAYGRTPHAHSPSLENVSFDGANLSNLDFINIRLENVSFRGADLEETTFSRVLMERVDFRGACLANARLSTVTTSFAPGSDRPQHVVDLRGADIRGASLSTELERVATTDPTTIVGNLGDSTD